MTSKVCIDCKVDKPLDDFYRHSSNTTGRQSRCKRCDNIRRTRGGARRGVELLGHLSDPTHTHQEIAEVLGLTKQRVEQIEKTALLKLRKAAVRMGILLAALVVTACSGDRPAACRQKFYRAGDVSAVTCGPDSVRVDRLDHSFLCCPGDQ